MHQGEYACRVALRKESVDRNSTSVSIIRAPSLSLSARRAWIEIQARASSALSLCVALRKESVDRNTKTISCPMTSTMSLSARRAWIEIAHPHLPELHGWVALRKESVDRNSLTPDCPPPLSVALRKESVDRNTSSSTSGCRLSVKSLSARRAWIEITLVQIIMSGYARGRSPQGERG